MLQHLWNLAALVIVCRFTFVHPAVYACTHAAAFHPNMGWSRSPFGSCRYAHDMLPDAVLAGRPTDGRCGLWMLVGAIPTNCCSGSRDAGGVAIIFVEELDALGIDWTIYCVS